MKFPFNLKAARESKSLSQSDLSRLSGISVRTIKALESKPASNAYPHTVVALQNILHPKDESNLARFGFEQLSRIHTLDRYVENYGVDWQEIVRSAHDLPFVAESFGDTTADLLWEFLTARKEAAQEGFEPYITEGEFFDENIVEVAALFNAQGMPSRLVDHSFLEVIHQDHKFVFGLTYGSDLTVEIDGKTHDMRFISAWSAPQKLFDLLYEQVKVPSEQALTTLTTI